MTLEDVFDIKIPDEDAERINHSETTVRDICWYVEEKKRTH